MRRRRESPLEELLLSFALLPFWVSIVGAATFYLVLHFVPPMMAGTSMTAKLLVPGLASLAPWAAGLIIVAGLAGVLKRRWRRFLLSRASGIDAMRRMDWQDFELLVGEVYRQRGYAVTERGGAQADGGIDLELRRESELVLVQCKHWRNRQVPVQRVRELLGLVMAEGASRGILVATGGFTADATEFASGNPIELIDGATFAKLVEMVRKPAVTKEAPRSTSKQPPLCPECGKPMVRRTARRGANAGSQFWGCASYPGCRGTLAA